MSIKTLYTIVKKVQQNGAFTYYQAVRKVDRLPVFLKVAPINNPAAIQLLKEEFELTQQIDPDWGVPTLALEKFRDEIVLVSPAFNGVNLQEYCKGKPLEIAEFLPIAINICSAIKKMHGTGLIHKDIKPTNILIDPTSLLVKIIDFSIATIVPEEQSQNESNLQFTAGSMPYISPEQTGRMNRLVDSRSDLYSLGITFYEIITGHLPFAANDALEWAYCHVAIAPDSPANHQKGIPPILADIILKLLSKTAEERYQTAIGLLHDLNKCLKQLENGKTIAGFPLGKNDVSNKLHVAQKLVGREHDFDKLLAPFNRVVQTGRTEIVVISGYSGIGKTSLVNELQKSTVEIGGIFMTSKLDQYKRGIPYYTIVEALKNLTKSILFQSEAHIAQWKKIILEAIGINGKIITDIIPQVALIIGNQPTLASVAPMESKIRFEAVLQKFIQVFAHDHHPLIIFLDDLQWADVASLDFIKQLVSNPDNNYILLIGSYRDNEVSPSHPLSLALTEISTSGPGVTTIKLNPLTIGNVQQLIANTLTCDVQSTKSLAGLVHKKTGGNPFFTIQFLHTLHQEKLLTFNSRNQSWNWEIKEIEAKGYTENVVDLMTQKIELQSKQTQNILTTAASIGNKFSINLLANLIEQEENVIINALKKPLIAGLVRRNNNQYEFTHDRIQQAAYSLLSEAQQINLHCKIGTYKLAHTPVSQLDEEVFIIANHFSQSDSRSITESQKIEVAELFLRAGKKAKSSAAYVAAKGYCQHGINLLPKNAWKNFHALTFQLHRELAATEYLVGNFEISEKLFHLTLSKLSLPIEKASVYNTQLELCHVLGKFEEAAKLGLEALTILGLPFPETDADQAAYAELLQVQEQLKNVAINELLHKPDMTDPVIIAAMEILMNLYAPFYNSRPHLLGLLTFRMTNYSLRHGNTASTPYAYVYYGILLGTGMGDFKQGQAFGDMAMALNEKLGRRELWCKVLQTYGTLVHPWSNPLTSCLPYLNKSYLAGLETGDLIFSGFAVGVNTSLRIMNGHRLTIVKKEAEQYLDFFIRSKDEMMRHAHQLFIQQCACLLGETDDPNSLSDKTYDEDEALKNMTSNKFAYSFHWYYLIKMQLHFHNNELKEAHANAIKIKDSIGLVHFAQVSVAEFYFFYGLILCGLYPKTTKKTKETYQSEIQFSLEKLTIWCSNFPTNFEHKQLLLTAEFERVTEVNNEVVMKRYDAAIVSAHAAQFIQNEAIAYELAARFYQSIGFPIIEKSYAKNARDLYLAWGAKHKATSLEALYPSFQAVPEPSTGSTTSLNLHQLDLNALTKASQAISGELILEKITESLLHVVMEQAGAQKGVLYLANNEKLTVAAEAVLVEKTIKISTYNPTTPLPKNQNATKFALYVQRTKETILIDEGIKHPPIVFANELARSIACVPIIKQANLVGVLYLENNAVRGAFSRSKIDIIEILAAQVALSIENTFSLEDLTKSETRLRLTMKQLPGMIWTTDDALKITSVVGSLLPKIGLKADNLTGNKLNKVLGTANPDFPGYIAHQNALKGISDRFDFALKSYLLEASVEPLKNSQGEIFGCIGVAFDITERMEYIKAIEDKNTKLKEIAWIQSHLVRAPLSRIMGLIDLFKMPSTPNNPINKTEILDFIMESAVELDAIIHDIVGKTYRTKM